MTILDRVKERTESDLSDGELQNLIDEAVNDITIKVGPEADPLNPINVLLDGNREKVVVLRPIDTTETIVVIEQWDSLMGMTTVTLTSNDYRIWPGGFTLERRFDGLTDIPRRLWGDRVQITYTPVDDSTRRDEVTVKLVILSLQYDGFTSQTIGDFQGTTDDYNSLRGKLIENLSPRSGMLML